MFGGLFACSVALAIVGPMLAQRLGATYDVRAVLVDGFALTVRSSPFSTDAYFVCHDGSECVEVPDCENWTVLYEDPLVLGCLQDSVLREERVFGRSSGELVAVLAVPPGASAESGGRVRAENYLVEAVGMPGAIIRVLSLESGDIVAQWNRSSSDAPRLRALSVSRFRVELGEDGAVLDLHGPTLRSLFPEGATDACFLGNEMAAVVGGCLLMSRGEGAAWDAVSCPGEGSITNCVVASEFGLVLWRAEAPPIASVPTRLGYGDARLPIRAGAAAFLVRSSEHLVERVVRAEWALAFITGGCARPSPGPACAITIRAVGTDGDASLSGELTADFGVGLPAFER